MKFWLVRLASILAAFGFCFAVQMLTSKLNSYDQRLIIMASVYVTLAVSLNLINGITGQFSIGHAAFWMVGAYSTGYITNAFFAKANMPEVAWIFLMMIVGAIFAALAGLLVGLPSLRLRGDYLAIVTLAFGEILRLIVQNTEAVGGAYGMKIKPQITIIWVVVMLAVITIAVSRNLLKTAQGLAFLAVREDEVASSAMGVNVTRIKVLAFVLGSAFAGAAGAVFAHNETFITPSTFSMAESFMILTMVVLGGTGSITGSALAAIVLYILPEQLRKVPDVSGSAVVAGALAILVGVGMVRFIQQKVHRPNNQKAGMYVGAIVLAIGLQFVFGAILKSAPQLAALSYKAADLRWPIFAITLITLMLVRPQGVFAHHEFSWTFLKRVFGGSKRAEARV